MIVDKDYYFANLYKMDVIPFLQSEEWVNSLMFGEFNFTDVYIVNSLEEILIMCFGRVTQNWLYGKKLMIDGISVKREVDVNQMRDFFKSLLLEDFDIVEISDISQYNPNFEIAIRQAGYKRPLGLNLCPMSLIVDLQNDFSFHRNWRRAVKKSKDFENVFSVEETPNNSDILDFIDLFGELKKRKGLGFDLTIEQLNLLLKGNYKLFYIKNKDGRKIASRISYVNDNLVYDVYAANSDEAIKTGAVYHIQEEILNYYKNLGLRYFDYGRISPSNDDMNNIYVSKSFSGGYPIAYNGQWNFYKSQIIEYFYSFLLFVKRKIHRY